MSELEKVELNDAEVKEATGGLFGGGTGICIKNPPYSDATAENCKGCSEVSRSMQGSHSYQCTCGNGVPGIWLEMK